jgi:hypothetical protein
MKGPCTKRPTAKNSARPTVVHFLPLSSLSAKSCEFATFLDYDLLIWLDGDEVRRAEDLRAALLMRGQEKRNTSPSP